MMHRPLSFFLLALVLGACADSAPASPVDAAPDLATDLGFDAPPDVSFDASPDASPDALPDQPADASVDAPADALLDTPGDVDPCAPNPCAQPGRTRCEAQGAIARCLCDLGSRDDGTGRCVPDVRCEVDSCNGHGRCDDGGGAVRCTCDAGYAGARCAACAPGFFSDGRMGCTATPCAPNPCVTPDRTRCSVGPMGAVCDCNSGTHEEMSRCVPDLTCATTTCNGHGVCAVESGGLRCTCAAGYTGARCDACAADAHPDGRGGCTSDPCVPSPCSMASRSVCVAVGLTARCDCDAAFHLSGDRCVPDERCAADTCSGHGTCTVGAGVASCSCASGYTGARCEACASGFHADGRGGCTSDPCLPSPCVTPRRTVCSAMGSVAVCGCDAGYHLDGVGGCTNDPCLPDPCAARNLACRAAAGAAECFAPPCNDGNPCTDDALVGGRCASTRRADGSACATSACRSGERCAAGVCAGGAALRCDDGNPCTRDRCEPMTGCASSHDDGLSPDDGVACTLDRCAAGRASNTPADSVCDDARYCTGVERCAPTSVGADSRGCVVTSVPTAPAPPSACSSYACDEATRAFVLAIRAGMRCDDTIACTTGDTCVASGACVGAATAACSSPPTACASVTPLGSTLDLLSARVQGAVTLDGAPLPRTLTSPQVPGYAGTSVYLRALDTGVRHLVAAPNYLSGTGIYTLAAASDRVDANVPPGVYDLMLVHNVLSSGHVGRYPTDPIPSAERVLQRAVVLGPGLNALAVDLTAARLTGAVTLEGAALPRTLTATQVPGFAGSTLYLRAQDTGVRHIISVPNYLSRTGVYSLATDSDRIDANVSPGLYDLVFVHNVSSTGNVGRYPTDPIPSSERVLRAGVVIPRGASTLDVDLTGARITGAVTLEGAPLPPTLTALQVPGFAGSTLYLRAQDTGVQHIISAPNYLSRTGVYSLAAGSDRVDANVPPGVYDLVFVHNVSSSGNVGRYPTDPIPSSERVLRSGVVIPRGASTLDVDLTGARVTGAVTLGGAPLARTLTALQVPGFAGSTLYLRAQDTGVRHIISVPNYLSATGVYALAAGSDRVDANVPPGVYDLVFVHNVSSTGNVGRYPTDPIPSSDRVLRRGVVIPRGASSLDVDLVSARVTGAVILDGAPMPRTLTALQVPGFAGSTVYLRAQDTGVRHIISVPNYLSATGVYALAAGSDRVDANVPPGVYDLVFVHNVSSTGNVGRYPTDPIPSSERVLRTDVMIAPGANTLDVSLVSARLSGAVTLDGAAFPRTLGPLQVPGFAGSSVYLQARDTGVRHLISAPNYLSATGVYSLATGSDRIDANVPPGVYDLVFVHNVSSTGNVGRYPTDPIPSSVRVLRSCVSVP